MVSDMVLKLQYPAIGAERCNIAIDFQHSQVKVKLVGAEFELLQDLVAVAHAVGNQLENPALNWVADDG